MPRLVACLNLCQDAPTRLNDRDASSPFPDPREADEHGLVAVGGDFRPRLLIAAYARGIFPWPTPELPYLWFSPDPRAILLPAELHVSRRLRQTIRSGRFRVTFDHAFEAVMRGCKAAPRPGQDGTWILEEMIGGYAALHRRGLAHSVEAWLDDRLVGGVYGVAMGTMFCGESMFYREPDASKVAFVHLVERLRDWGYRFVDCQVETPHVKRFGARPWPRERFLAELATALREPGRPGSWRDVSAGHAAPRPAVATRERGPSL